jgi:hypothetical protein
MYFYFLIIQQLNQESKEDHADTLKEGQAGETIKFLDFILTLKELTSFSKRTHTKAKKQSLVTSSILEVEPILH